MIILSHNEPSAKTFKRGSFALLEHKEAPESRSEDIAAIAPARLSCQLCWPQGSGEGHLQVIYLVCRAKI
jgi:hypothetical protein